jgi:hypothetical protein
MMSYLTVAPRLSLVTHVAKKPNHGMCQAAGSCSCYARLTLAALRQPAVPKLEGFFAAQQVCVTLGSFQN